MAKKKENLQHKMSNIGNIKENYSIKKIDKETVNVRIDNKDLLISILGQFNQNIKSLEKLTKTEIFSRGNSITAKGKEDSINKFSEAIKFLANKYFLTKSIDQDDINLSVKAEIDLKNKNNVHSIDQLIKTPKKSVIARSKRQSEYIESLRNNDIIFALGPAGTGKSFLAVSVAITMLMEKKIGKVILSRPAVEAGEKLGFLPGDMKEKVDPYLRPLYDALYDLFGYEIINKKIENGEIEIAPLAFMRGRTLKKFICHFR